MFVCVAEFIVWLDKSPELTRFEFLAQEEQGFRLVVHLDNRLPILSAARALVFGHVESKLRTKAKERLKRESQHLSPRNAVKPLGLSQ
jgi:hypothetical protein